MTASTLLAALIAASSATNGVITVGDTQPFDQVRLYQNPANGTVLTNQSSDGSIDTSSTALVITGSTAPTGLVFNPNLAVLRNVTSDIKLLVDTPIELTLSINIAGTLTQMTVEAGKTAVLTLGLIAGIPMIVGAFDFFPVASPSTPAETGLLLIPTGASESTDGIYQRFTYDGLRVTYLDLMGEEGNPARYGWSAELSATRIGDVLAVNLKMPDLSGNKSANVFIADQTAEEITSGVLSREIFGGTSGYNYISLELRPDQGGVTLNVHNAADPFNPVVLPLNNNVLDGDPIAVNLVGSNVIVEHSGSSQTLTLPSGFFSGVGLPNIVAFSMGETVADSAAMSVKVVTTATESVVEL